MKKKHIFLISFIGLLAFMSITTCSIYKNDKVQALGRSDKQSVIWYMDGQFQEGIQGLALSIHPQDAVISLDSELPAYLQTMITDDLKEEYTKSFLKLKKDANFEYYAKDLVTGKEYGDKKLSSLTEKTLRNESLVYGVLNYDSKGTPTISGDFTKFNYPAHLITEYLNYLDYSSNGKNTMTYYVNGEAFTKALLQNPKQLSIIFRIPKNIVRDDGIIAGTVYDWSNYGEFSLMAVLIGTVLLALFLLFYPIHIVQEINPFQTFRKIKFGILFILLCTGITFAVTGIVALSGSTISGTLLINLNEYHIEMSKEILFVVNVAAWMMVFTLIALALFEIKYMFVKGFKRFWKEDTLTGSLFSRIHRSIDNFADIDLKEDGNRRLFRFMLMQILIMAVLCMLWWFGMILAIIYGFALFMWLKKKLNSVQHDYCTLLNQTKELKEGNFQSELPEDVGIFNALKDEFSEIRIGFEKAVQEETKSQNMKTELISNVSHDLKTPLTGIRNYVELLQQEGNSEEQQKEYIAMLDQYAGRLHELMEDLFEVSKANSGNIQLDMAKVDIIALVEQVQAECSDMLQEQQLDVVWNLHDHKQLSVMLDGSKACRIFENLFTNIHHYALEHTRVYIDMQKVSDHVRIECKNISREPLNFDANEIVDRFIRGDKSRHGKGSGLGLAIAKSFTEAMQGSFHIEVDGDLFKAVLEFPLEKEEDNSSVEES